MQPAIPYLCRSESGTGGRETLPTVAIFPVSRIESVGESHLSLVNKAKLTRETQFTEDMGQGVEDGA